MCGPGIRRLFSITIENVCVCTRACMHSVGVCPLRFDFFLEITESYRPRETRSWWGEGGSERERGKCYSALLGFPKET